MGLSWRAVFPEETTNSRHAKVHHPSQATLFWTFLNFFKKKHFHFQNSQRPMPSTIQPETISIFGEGPEEFAVQDPARILVEWAFAHHLFHKMAGQSPPCTL
jgi:hypothetical protein